MPDIDKAVELATERFTKALAKDTRSREGSRKGGNGLGAASDGPEGSDRF